MKRKRLFIILGILLAVTILLTILNLGRSGDDSRTQLDSLFNNNRQLIGLSEIAREDAGLYGLQVIAASLLATTTSDNQQLVSYYEEQYGKSPKATKLSEDSDPVAALEATEAGSGFDASYKEDATSLLQANLELSKAIQDGTPNPDLRLLLAAIYANQASGLEQLQKLR